MPTVSYNGKLYEFDDSTTPLMQQYYLASQDPAFAPEKLTEEEKEKFEAFRQRAKQDYNATQYDSILSYPGFVPMEISTAAAQVPTSLANFAAQSALEMMKSPESVDLDAADRLLRLTKPAEEPGTGFWGEIGNWWAAGRRRIDLRDAGLEEDEAGNIKALPQIPFHTATGPGVSQYRENRWAGTPLEQGLPREQAYEFARAYKKQAKAARDAKPIPLVESMARFGSNVTGTVHDFIGTPSKYIPYPWDPASDELPQGWEAMKAEPWSEGVKVAQQLPQVIGTVIGVSAVSAINPYLGISAAFTSEFSDAYNNAPDDLGESEKYYRSLQHGTVAGMAEFFGARSVVTKMFGKEFDDVLKATRQRAGRISKVLDYQLGKELAGEGVNHYKEFTKRVATATYKAINRGKTLPIEAVNLIDYKYNPINIVEALTEGFQTAAQSFIMEDRPPTFDEFVLSMTLGGLGGGFTQIMHTAMSESKQRVDSGESTVEKEAELLLDKADAYFTDSETMDFLNQYYAGVLEDTEDATATEQLVSYLQSKGIKIKENVAFAYLTHDAGLPVERIEQQFDLKSTDPTKRMEELESLFPGFTDHMADATVKAQHHRFEVQYNTPTLFGQVLSGDISLQHFYSTLRLMFTQGLHIQEGITPRDMRFIRNIFKDMQVIPQQDMDPAKQMPPDMVNSIATQVSLAHPDAPPTVIPAGIRIVQDFLYNLATKTVNPNTGQKYTNILDFVTNDYRVLTIAYRDVINYDGRLGASPYLGYAQLEGEFATATMMHQPNIETMIHEIMHWFYPRDSVKLPELQALRRKYLALGNLYPYVPQEFASTIMDTYIHTTEYKEMVKKKYPLLAEEIEHLLSDTYRDRSDVLPIAEQAGPIIVFDTETFDYLGNTTVPMFASIGTKPLPPPRRIYSPVKTPTLVVGTDKGVNVGYTSLGLTGKSARQIYSTNSTYSSYLQAAVYLKNSNMQGFYENMTNILTMHKLPVTASAEKIVKDFAAQIVKLEKENPGDAELIIAFSNKVPHAGNLPESRFSPSHITYRLAQQLGRTTLPSSDDILAAALMRKSKPNDSERNFLYRYVKENFDVFVDAIENSRTSRADGYETNNDAIGIFINSSNFPFVQELIPLFNKKNKMAKGYNIPTLYFKEPVLKNVRTTAEQVAIIMQERLHDTAIATEDGPIALDVTAYGPDNSLICQESDRELKGTVLYARAKRVLNTQESMLHEATAFELAERDAAAKRATMGDLEAERYLKQFTVSPGGITYKYNHPLISKLLDDFPELRSNKGDIPAQAALPWGLTTAVEVTNYYNKLSGRTYSLDFLARKTGYDALQGVDTKGRTHWTVFDPNNVIEVKVAEVEVPLTDDIRDRAQYREKYLEETSLRKGRVFVNKQEEDLFLLKYKGYLKNNINWRRAMDEAYTLEKANEILQNDVSLAHLFAKRVAQWTDEDHAAASLVLMEGFNRVVEKLGAGDKPESIQEEMFLRFAAKVSRFRNDAGIRLRLVQAVLIPEMIQETMGLLLASKLSPQLTQLIAQMDIKDFAALSNLGFKRIKKTLQEVQELAIRQADLTDMQERIASRLIDAFSKLKGKSRQQLTAQELIDLARLMDLFTTSLNKDKVMRGRVLAFMYTNLLSSVLGRTMDMASNLVAYHVDYAATPFEYAVDLAANASRTLLGKKQEWHMTYEELNPLIYFRSLFGGGWKGVKKAKDIMIGKISLTDATNDWDIKSGYSNMLLEADAEGPWLSKSGFFKLIRTVPRAVVAVDALVREMATSRAQEVLTARLKNLSPADRKVLVTRYAQKSLEARILHPKLDLKDIIDKAVDYTTGTINPGYESVFVTSFLNKYANMSSYQSPPDAFFAAISKGADTLDNLIMARTIRWVPPLFGKEGSAAREAAEYMARVPIVRSTTLPFRTTLWNVLKLSAEISPLYTTIPMFSPYALFTPLAYVLNGRTIREAAARQLAASLLEQLLHSLFDDDIIFGPAETKEEIQYRIKNGIPNYGIKVDIFGETNYFEIPDPFAFALVPVINNFAYQKKMQREGMTRAEAIKAYRDGVKATESYMQYSTFLGYGLQGLAGQINAPRIMQTWVPFSKFLREWTDLYRSFHDQGEPVVDKTQIATLQERLALETQATIDRFPFGRNINRILGENVPGFEETVPYEINMFGQTVARERFLGLPQLFGWRPDPIYEPLDALEREFDSLEKYPRLPPRRRMLHGGEVELTRPIYQDYCLTYGSLAKKMILPLIQTPTYQGMTDEGKLDFLTDQLEKCREIAWKVISASYPELHKQGIEKKIEDLRRKYGT